MHGRLQREGEESSTGSERSIGWHMHSAVIAADSNSFFKDGRRISVGDCALFKPPQDCPPFIGLIRSLSLSKENILQLRVNWIYRPSEIKLGKGALLDGAPNEIFYSFHKDEIPAASLLHPCKVAFLPRGIELPKGTYSFVCRRVYDIANKCLWWLTDQDYIDERQEEVDQLLNKTKREMHATLQAGGRSPKQGNGPTSTSQMKPGSDSVQNTSGNSLQSQVRGKKRERDHGADPLRRERSSRIDDGSSTLYRTESDLKTEISRIAGKGLFDLEGVDKLVHLMQQDKMGRKMDFGSRSLLANVIASIDKVECLNQFIALRGLTVLDEWLQEVHKGKSGDGNSTKDSDKSVEEFLLVLLRALDKLPVNLQALQMCNIGRSVNHLRSHKNIDIQRKARSLVDTWKKRVEAEMISIDAKSGSTQTGVPWPSKSRLPEASHGIKTPVGSDVAIKSVITPNSAAKTTLLRSSHGENTIKQETSYGPVKQASSPSSGKESQLRTTVSGSADAVQIREDRSSSSIQSYNNSQSSSPKDDQKSSPSSALAITRTSSNSTRSRKNSGVSEAGSQKETSSCKNSSAHKITAVEKLSQPALTSEEMIEGPTGEANGQKLITKIAGKVRSPAQVSGGSVDDPTFMNSQTSSPVHSDKHEQIGHTSLEKTDSHQCNASDINTLQNNEHKAVLTGPAGAMYSKLEQVMDTWGNNFIEKLCLIITSKNVSDINSQQNDEHKAVVTRSEGAGSPKVIPHEEQNMITEESKRMMRSPKNKMEQVRLHSSFSPMNALIESCVKYAETSIEDDVGMNLLASVAAGEMSRSDMVTPTDSTERSSPAIEEVCASDEAKSKPLQDDYAAGIQNQSPNGAECNGNKQAVSDVLISGDRKDGPSDTYEDLSAGEGTNGLGSSRTNLPVNAEPVSEISEKPKENTSATTSLALPISMEKVGDGESNEQVHDKKAISGNIIAEAVSNGISGEGDGLVTEHSTDNLTVDVSNQIIERAKLKALDGGKFLNDGLDATINSHQKLTGAEFKFGSEETIKNERLHQNECAQKPVSQADGDVVKQEPDDKDDKSYVTKSGKLNFDMESAETAAGERNSATGLCCTSNVHKKEVLSESQDIKDRISLPENMSPGSMEPDIQIDAGLTRSISASHHLDEAGECGSTCAETTSSSTRASDVSAKLTFDLNEGFSADDGKYEEIVTSTSSGSETVHASNLLPFSQSSLRSSQIASITVAAAAKGAFVLRDDLMRSKVEFGWKGSAATSAFRPAEPRKVVEMSLGVTNMACSDASTNKHGRIPLDFDLNVPDERVLEEMVSRGSNLAVDSSSNCATIQNEVSKATPFHGCGGLDLDLNRVDETYGNGHCTTSSTFKGEGSNVHVEPLGLLPCGDTRRNFDLNNGPVVDDPSGEQLSINQLVKGGISGQLPSAGPRVNSISSWFPSGDTYSTVAVPSMLPDRGEHPVPVFPTGAPPRTFGQAAVAPYSPDVLRGSVLSSSPAVPFPSGPYQLPIFPFGTPFPFPPATFSVGTTSYADSSSGARLFAPPANTQFLGPFGSAASQFQRPYVVSLPDVSANGGLESNRKWDRQGLDLNAGPGGMESRTRVEMMPLSSGQHSVSSSQGLAEEQARMFPISGTAVLKRKEPEGGWDGESIRHKQSSWQ